MKKFVSLFLLLFTLPAWASGIGTNTLNASCDNATLDKYTGAADIEINWEPNTIGLNWYDGDTKLTVQQSAQSCVYDSTITVPPAPTKPGYTFNGWKVIHVPGGCKKIEYLESNGSQYINTGYSAPNGFKAQVGVYMSVINGGSFVMGAHNDPSTSAADRNYLKVSYDGHVEIGAGDCYWSSYIIQSNTKYDIEFSTVKNNIFLTGDNIVDKCGNGFVDRSLHALYLFGVNWANYLNGVFVGRIYYAKIYDENGTMVRDFIPILDKNNVPCMWDKITGQFFYNAGTGNFVAGPVVQ